ncbi:MAG: M12 family metallo-peptidase [Saprospiraceae bacterium]|nr:M12 family metallo-peptidase [Saprospiraceae bacterium]
MRNPHFILMALLCLTFSFVSAQHHHHHGHAYGQRHLQHQTHHQHNLKDQKPLSLVKHAKAEKVEFKAVSLLRQSDNQQVNNTIAAEAASYTLLDVSPIQLNRLTNSHQEAISLIIPTTAYGALELELVEVEITSNMQVYLSSTNEAAKVELNGVFYRGIIKNDSTSLVSLSVFENEISGIISSPNIGNLVIGKLKSEEENAQHIIYNDINVMDSHELNCETEDDGVEYTREELDYHAHARNSTNCVEIYLEVDNDIYQSFGGVTNTMNYITSLFNEVATLYANDGVSIKISEIFIWDTTSPYNGTSSSQMLSQFQQQINSFNGNLGMLVSYQASGGIAVLDGVCHPLVDARLCFSSISSNFQQVPTYSWSVMVMAHELGHLMGSRHTHACVWNGNGTAIDGCAGFTEGSCQLPGNPAGGGTIMSYCHITSVGINFSKGFGPQPGSVILNTIDNASCLTACGPTCSDGIQNGDEEGIDCGGSNCAPCQPAGGGDDDPACTDNTLILELQLDDYSFETTWAVYDDSGDMVFEVGPYEKEQEEALVRDTFCLADGCYTFEIYDAYGDGICCEYGNGYYKLRNSDNEILAQGGEFEALESTNFCVPDDYSSGGGDCIKINFNDYEVLSFGGSQDAGDYQIQEDGRLLRIENNAWKAIYLPYQVTETTVLEFDFGSTLQGEIHGIGFDDNNSISSSKTFKVHGTQNWGINAYDNYEGGNMWQHYTIPVGDYYQGDFIYLFFVADHDSGPQNGNSFFRNVQVHEGDPCGSSPDDDGEGGLIGGEEASLEVFPNPTTNILNLKVSGMQSDATTLQVFNMMGQLVFNEAFRTLQGIDQGQLDVSRLSQGSYILRLQDGKEELVQKFTITR